MHRKPHLIKNKNLNETTEDLFCLKEFYFKIQNNCRIYSEKTVNGKREFVNPAEESLQRKIHNSIEIS